jgi:transposase|tara:strand:+ start:1107 stop:1292 length:186 start_codon:yes stop_codon:yes gene_type:complete
MMMTRREVAHAQKLRADGKTFWEVAQAIGVGEATVRKWLRNYDRYGESLFSEQPKEIEDRE